MTKTADGSPVNNLSCATGERRSIVRRTGVPTSAATPLVTPLMPSAVYVARDADALDDQYEGRTHGYAYAREGHPNAEVLAQKIDWLEGVTPAMGRGIILSSGMAAIGAMFLGTLENGAHVVAGDQLYGRTLRMLTTDLPRLGVEVSFADATSAQNIEAALRPETKLIIIEAVSNPTLRIADVAGIAKLANERSILLAIDNTFTTPRAFQPYTHGADIVIHSVTKLLAGHSDVTLGYVSARTPALMERMYDASVTWGMTPSPFDCWLAERGLHTFELRYDRAEENAARLATLLAEQPGVEAVIYPGRVDHPDGDLSARIMGNRTANMVSFRLRDDRGVANRFIRAAASLPFAPTLGDVATTISHPPSSSHRRLSPNERAALGITEGFFRVSVGVEHFDVIGPEFADAIAAATNATTA